jgi:hypothetical protein
MVFYEYRTLWDTRNLDTNIPAFRAPCSILGCTVLQVPDTRYTKTIALTQYEKVINMQSPNIRKLYKRAEL